jgi:hypothetical protein
MLGAVFAVVVERHVSGGKAGLSFEAIHIDAQTRKIARLHSQSPPDDVPVHLHLK